MLQRKPYTLKYALRLFEININDGANENDKHQI
jgi:hypothetical protein